MRAMIWIFLAIGVAAPLAAQEPTANDRGRTPERGERPVFASGYFYRAGVLALEGEVRPLGRIAERLSSGVVARELPPQVQLHDHIYVTLDAPNGVRVGERLHLHRRGRVVPPYGHLYEPTGIATVEVVEGHLATARVVQVYERMVVGDLAFPLAEFPVPVGAAPRAVEGQDLQGAILAFQSPGVLHRIEDIALLNLGALSGIREGDEFMAYAPGRRQEPGPDVIVARLQVVRVGERTSAARVVAMNFPALEPGLAVRRIARIP